MLKELETIEKSKHPIGLIVKRRKGLSLISSQETLLFEFLLTYRMNALVKGVLLTTFNLNARHF